MFDIAKVLGVAQLGVFMDGATYFGDADCECNMNNLQSDNYQDFLC